MIDYRLLVYEIFTIYGHICITSKKKHKKTGVGDSQTFW